MFIKMEHTESFKEFELNLDYPISTNKIQRFKPKKLIQYQEKAKQEALNFIKKPFDGYFEIDIILHPKRPKNYLKRLKENRFYYLDVRCIDLDNCTKVLLDSFNNVVFKDDKKIVKINLLKSDCIENGGVNIKFKLYNCLQNIK